jgi:hypothetical protein
VKKTLFVVALVALASVTLFAQDVRVTLPTHVTNNAPNVGHVTPYHAPAKLKKIYSNLGSSTDAFYYADGWLILGSSSAFGESQWIGYAFTPTKNHTATEVQAAAFYYSSGTNDFNYGIWSDASGVPGTELKGADKKNLPTWTGSSTDCCKTQAFKFKALKLKAKTQYWVVGENAASATDAEGVWDFIWNETTGTQAYDINNAGWTTETTYFSAFAVYGTK